MTCCITDITYCVDITIPTETVWHFLNNKPWIISDLKEILNKKKRTFRDGGQRQI